MYCAKITASPPEFYLFSNEHFCKLHLCFLRAFIFWQFISESDDAASAVDNSDSKKVISNGGRQTAICKNLSDKASIKIVEQCRVFRLRPLSPSHPLRNNAESNKPANWFMHGMLKLSVVFSVQIIVSDIYKMKNVRS